METPRLEGVCFFGGYVEGYPRSDVLRKGLDKLGVRVRSCRVSHKKKMFRRYAGLLKQYRAMERDFDVILVPEFRHKDVPLAALLARFTGKLCVFDPLVSRYDTKIKDRGDARDRTFQSWHNRNLDRMSMTLPDLVLADTRAHADYFRDEFLPKNREAVVLPVGYDEELFCAPKEPPAASGPRTVLFYGNYLPLHGVETIVRAARRLQDDPSIRIELIGGGQTFAAVERYVKKQDLKNVCLLDRVPVTELPGKIAAATVCLGIFGDTPKAGRVVPNKVYQCMGMGKAVITERSPAMEELFEHGRDVVLVPAADEAGLAQAIAEMCRNGADRERIAQNGLRRVREAFTSRHIAEMFVEYCSALKNGTKSASDSEGVSSAG